MTDLSIGRSLPITKLTGARAFSMALFAATVVPYLPFTLIGGQPQLAQLIIFLAAIHIPMTGYLLLDPEIRGMIRRQPINLGLGSVAIFAAGFGGYAWLSSVGDLPFMVFMMTVMLWNNWHFGKQNVGVYSFMRLAQSLGSMNLTERRLIVAGSSFGVLSVVLSAPIFYKYAPGADFSVLTGLVNFFRPIAAVAAIALLLATLFYIARNRQRMTWTSALVLIVSANFFLPTFLWYLSVPNIFFMTILAHGCQYVVFLFFHAANYQGGRYGAALMFPVFVVAVLIAGELYHFNWLRPEGVAYFGQATIMGILLTHFWIDQTVWRLKNDNSRRWVMKRYSFLFGR